MAEVFLAFSGETPAGFALFFQNFSTFLARPGIYLEDLFVRPEFRSLGIGRALLGRIAHLAVERGCGRFEWAVLDWNENAIGFYKKLGAQLMDDWRICRVTGRALEHLATAFPKPSNRFFSPSVPKSSTKARETVCLPRSEEVSG